MMKNSQSTNRRLILFFILTLGWTWIFGFIPIYFNITGTTLGTFLFYFGGGAPSVVGLFFVFITYSKEARREYFHRCFSFRYMGWKYFLAIILFFIFITIIGLFIGTQLMHLEMPKMYFLKSIGKTPYMILPILLISFVSGPLNEEFGWRGYALDKLLVQFGYFGSSIILGFIWGIWHLAWYFTPGQAQYDLLQASVFDAVIYMPSIILLNFFVTFIYVKTKRSILAGAMVHMFGNLINSQMLSPYSTDIGMVIRYTKMTFCIIIVIYTCYSSKFKKEVMEQIQIISGEEV